MDTLIKYSAAKRKISQTYRILQHGRRDLHDVRKDCLAAEPAGQPVQSALGHHGVAVAIFLLKIYYLLCRLYNVHS